MVARVALCFGYPPDLIRERHADLAQLEAELFGEVPSET
jgi:hypothetical protein